MPASDAGFSTFVHGLLFDLTLPLKLPIVLDYHNSSGTLTPYTDSFPSSSDMLLVMCSLF